MRLWRYGLAVIVAAGVCVAAPAQKGAMPNERQVKPKPNALDPDDIYEKDGKTYKDGSKIWVLEFTFKDPRIITVDIPGRGRKVCWYLWYQVVNRTGEPHTFIPDFELVTLDKQTVHRDQVLPKVQAAIQKLEDPTGFLNIKNSVTISADPIPPSKPNTATKKITGVAIWDDVNPDTTRFDIFVSGLSNGFALTDPILKGGPQEVRRKTLQLSFRRPGDRFYQRSEEIQFMGTPEWIYRGSNVKLPTTTKAKDDKEKPPAKP
jgi:hypothetical protein